MKPWPPNDATISSWNFLLFHLSLFFLVICVDISRYQPWFWSSLTTARNHKKNPTDYFDLPKAKLPNCHSAGPKRDEISRKVLAFVSHGFFMSWKICHQEINTENGSVAFLLLIDGWRFGVVYCKKNWRLPLTKPLTPTNSRVDWKTRKPSKNLSSMYPKFVYGPRLKSGWSWHETKKHLD